MKFHVQGICKEKSEMIIFALEKAGIVLQDIDCNLTIGHIVECDRIEQGAAKDTLARISLFALGSNLPDSVNALKGLKIAGNGECEVCGSNEVEGNFFFGRCEVCGHEVFYEPSINQ